jgi:phosphocarrier protein HPr
MMISKNVLITNETGIHARPASLFIQTASSFKSDITVAKNGKSGNAKSLLGLLALGINNGSEITITAEGEDEEAAVAALIKLVESKFGEK